MLEKPKAKQQQAILSCLSEQDGMTVKEIAQVTGIPERSLGATLSKMARAGYLRRVISKEVIQSSGMLRKLKLNITTFFLKN